MNTRFIELKEKIKVNAEYLKYRRLTRKQTYKEEHMEKLSTLTALLFTKSSRGYSVRTSLNCIGDIRYYHIAYSLLKGHKYEQIEARVRPEHELTDVQWALIKEIMEEVNEETVRVDS